MDALREEARKTGKATEGNVSLFNRLFLQSVEAYGRPHEMSMMMKYNLGSGQLFKDAFIAPELLKRGKMGLLPEKIHDQGAVKRIFAKARQANRGEQH
jgi:hypothetical protein